MKSAKLSDQRAHEIIRNPAPATALACDDPQDLKITLGLKEGSVGYDPGGDLVAWCPALAMNGHAAIAGASGSGKTQRLRVIANSIAQCSGAEVDIIDPHGDIICENETRVRFSEQSPFGLNPLRINPSVEGGGVRVQIENFLDGLEASSRTFGDKQRSVAREMLEGFYSLHGYDKTDPATWQTTPDRIIPGLDDFYIYAEEELRRMQLLLNDPAYKALAELKRAMRSFASHARGRTKADFDDLAEKAFAAFQVHVEDIRLGRADDVVLQPRSEDVIAGVVERIRTLQATGLYKSSAPPFGASRIRVWDVSKIRIREQRMFGEVLFDQHLRRLQLRGERQWPDSFLIVDEAHRYLESEIDRPLSRLMREVRKYGGSVILASQSISDFNKDVLSNCGPKIFLGMDTAQNIEAARKLQIDVTHLNNIRPRISALVQMSAVGRVNNEFIPIILPGSSSQVAGASTLRPPDPEIP